MRAALVVTTYNNPKSLGILLKSLETQTSHEWDLFIADDGSGQETKEKIDGYRSRLACSVEHLWHKDEGYRKATINNAVFRKIIEAKIYSLVICVDGDTFLNPHFVEDHVEAHRIHNLMGHSKVLFMGRRVELGPKMTSKINEENVLSFSKGLSLPLFISMFTKDTEHGFRALRLVGSGVRMIRKLFKMDQVRDLLGSNFSITTELLKEINGYNEDFKGYWGEDGDLFVRARNAGALLVGAKYYAVQFHLYHKRLEPTPEYQSHYLQLLKNTTYRRCENGINLS